MDGYAKHEEGHGCMNSTRFDRECRVFSSILKVDGLLKNELFSLQDEGPIGMQMNACCICSSLGLTVVSFLETECQNNYCNTYYTVTQLSAIRTISI